MLADVGMVKKSAHVMTWVLHGPALLLVAWTDWPPLFAWTGPPPCCMDRPSSLLHGPADPLLCMDRPSTLFLQIYARWFCHTLQVHTALSLHLPLFLEEPFIHTLCSLILIHTSGVSSLLKIWCACHTTQCSHQGCDQSHYYFIVTFTLTPVSTLLPHHF